MGTDAYKYLGDSLSNAGYIVAVVNTETGFNKGIQTFGADLASVADNMIGLNINTTSFFYNHIKNKAIVLGHSMGGLATFVSANLSNNIVATVNLSAADSGAIANAICSAITKPNFSITGTIDCVAPPATNAKLMYDALKSNCKYYINITGGTHCGMADQNAICSIGETCILGQQFINKAQQHSLILQPLYLFADYYLNANNASFTSFTNYISTADSFVFEKICAPLPIDYIFNKESITIAPNPASNVLHINTSNDDAYFYTIQNIYGQQILSATILNQNNTVNIAQYTAGIYMVTIKNKLHENHTYKFLKQ
jgi:dienelactone hydrolase